MEKVEKGDITEGRERTWWINDRKGRDKIRTRKEKSNERIGEGEINEEKK